MAGGSYVGWHERSVLGHPQARDHHGSALPGPSLGTQTARQACCLDEPLAAGCERGPQPGACPCLSPAASHPAVTAGGARFCSGPAQGCQEAVYQGAGARRSYVLDAQEGFRCPAPGAFGTNCRLGTAGFHAWGSPHDGSCHAAEEAGQRKTDRAYVFWIPPLGASQVGAL